MVAAMHCVSTLVMEGRATQVRRRVILCGVLDENSEFFLNQGERGQARLISILVTVFTNNVEIY